MHQSELYTVPFTPELHQHHSNTDNNDDDPIDLPEGPRPSNSSPTVFLNLDTPLPSKDLTTANTPSTPAPSSTSVEESARPDGLRHPPKYLGDYVLKQKETTENDHANPSSNPLILVLIQLVHDTFFFGSPRGTKHNMDS